MASSDLTRKSATNDAHDKGLSQDVLELSTGHSLVAAAHGPPGGQIGLNHAVPHLCQGCCSG